MSFGIKQGQSGVIGTGAGGNMPSALFRDSFVHGMSMFLGGVFGLCVWISFQPEPVIKPYVFDLSLVPPKVAPKIVETPVPVVAVRAGSPVLAVIPENTAPIVNVASVANKLPQAQMEPKPVSQPEPRLQKLSNKRDVIQEPLATSIDPASVTPSIPSPIMPVPPAVAVVTPFPAPGMTEDKPPYGPLPIIRAADHVRPFDVYRAPFPKENLDKPLIAVVVMDFGLSSSATSAVLQSMPAGTSVVVSRTARGATDVAGQAHQAGFEIWADLAVEPDHYPIDDPGVNALFSNASIEQNQDALYRQLGNLVGYAGIFSGGSSPYFTNNQDADFLSRALFSRGLGAVINTTQVDQTMAKNAATQHAPFFNGNMLRINEPVSAVRLMKLAEDQAQKMGYSVLLIPPSKGVGLMVQGWIKGLADKGIAIAPLSVIAERGLTLMAGR